MINLNTHRKSSRSLKSWILWNRKASILMTICEALRNWIISNYLPKKTSTASKIMSIYLMKIMNMLKMFGRHSTLKQWVNTMIYIWNQSSTCRCIWEVQKDLYAILQTRSLSLFHISGFIMGCCIKNDWY